MWRIEYDRSVKNYIYDSYPYTEAVWRAIKTLRNRADGLPVEGAVQLELDVYLWIVEGHQVVYRRIVAAQILRVLVLKPVA